MSYDLRKQLKQLKALKKRGLDHDQDEDLNSKLQDYARKKEILEKRCKQEEYYSIKTKYGQIVRYGHEIQLKHKLSGKIIAISKSSKTSQGLELKETARPDKCSFKIMPKYKYRAEGEKVIYNDYFVMFNSQAKSHIFINENESVKTELFNQPPTYRPEVKLRREPNSNLCLRYPLELKQRMGTRLQFIPYKHADLEASRFINGGDVVRIKHLGNDANLQNKSQDSECCLRRYRGTDSLEEKDSNSLFEVEVNSNEERGRYIYWKESQDNPLYESTDLLGLNSSDIMHDTDEANLVNLFKLRHVNSGRHLVVKKSNDGKYKVCLDKEPNLESKEEVKEYVKSTLFLLESQSVDPDRRLKPSIVCKIKHLLTNTYVSTSIDPDNILASKQVAHNEEDKSGDKYVPKGVFKQSKKSAIDTDTQILKTEGLEKSRDEDAFVFEQVGNDLIHDCFLIHTAIPILKEYVGEIRQKQDEKLRNKDRMRMLEHFLTQLIFFVTETEEDDPFKCEGIPYKNRQKLLRELKVIEVLADALYYPFQDNLFSLQRLAEAPPLARVCGLLYRLLKHIVQDYRLNEEYVAQWIELFFDHAMNTGEGVDSYSEATITAILTNNKKLLDSQIDKEDIAHIIDLCKNQRKHERFLNLLCCLCICQNEAVIGNQNNIVDLLTEEETKQFFVIPIRVSNDTFEAFISEEDSNDRDQWVDLAEIKDWSYRNDRSRIYGYLLSFLDLATSLCYDRNYKGINAFMSVFPIEIVYG